MRYYRVFAAAFVVLALIAAFFSEGVERVTMWAMALFWQAEYYHTKEAK